MRKLLGWLKGMRRDRWTTGPAPQDGEGVWLDDERAPGNRRGAPHRRLTGGVAALVTLAAVGVPVGIVLTAGGGGDGHRAHHLVHGSAFHQVVSALNATVDSGSFDITYQSDAPTPPTTSTTQPRCGPTATPKATSSPIPVCRPIAARGLTISGHGVTDTHPFAQETVSNVPGFGVITTFDNGTDLWELGGGNYGLSGGAANSSPGSPLSGFSNLVVGTLGPEQGAFDLLGLASPTGNFELEQTEITRADEIGTSTVDNVPVTVFQVMLDPSELAGMQTLTSQQAMTIRGALALLEQQGFTGETVKVSIDASGFVRQTQSVASFSDGTTISGETTLSDFGCAGTVVMPGQQGASNPPANCVSPDTGRPTTTTTITTPPSTSSTTGTPGTPGTTTASTPPATSTTTNANANGGTGSPGTTSSGMGNLSPTTTGGSRLGSPAG